MEVKTLTEEEIEEMRGWYTEASISITELAAYYHVSEETVKRIVRKEWNEVSL